RLEPLDTLFASMAREARRLARSMEFDLEVIVGGEDVIADRHVMNGLRQPLLHLVRNAVDHGLRNLPADRPAELTLRATLDGSHLVIEVRDNGRGIDLEAVANHAVAAGLDVERLTDQERADLVFHAGLSTRDEVSAMSGRGVGLGAVRAAAEALHGRAYIASTGQNGTCMKLQVPQRSASVPSLLLSVGQARVALATSRVDRVIDLRTTPPVRSGGADVVIVDGRPVALLDGGSVVSEPAGSRRWAVVVATPHGRQAMTVDAVSSGQNLVVRPLPSTLGELPGVTGAALTSDGSLVAVILTSLLVSRGKPAARSASTQDTQVVQSKQRRILVVDDSATTRTLIRTILSSSGHDVTTAADGQQARDLLRDHTFDLVVSDIDMPKLSGLELTKAIRATPSLRDLPVILVSARDSDSDRVESADAGADVHLSKGQFDQGELLRFTAELLP
ncbi:MAG: two-component system chemotaxis sensor kinase CheA, partial [Glaciecola sp.]